VPLVLAREGVGYMSKQIMKLSINELHNYMKNNIAYGYIDGNNNKYDDVNQNFDKIYILQSPEQLLKSKRGVCWDQVEFERTYFESNGYKYKTFFLVYYDENDCPTHTFLTYKQNDEWIWFENSWELHRGLHKYYDIESLLKDVKEKFIKSLNKIERNTENLFMYEYDKPDYGIDCLEFCKHAEQGKNV